MAYLCNGMFGVNLRSYDVSQNKGKVSKIRNEFRSYNVQARSHLISSKPILKLNLKIIKMYKLYVNVMVLKRQRLLRKRWSLVL